MGWVSYVIRLRRFVQKHATNGPAAQIDAVERCRSRGQADLAGHGVFLILLSLDAEQRRRLLVTPGPAVGEGRILPESWSARVISGIGGEIIRNK